MPVIINMEEIKQKMHLLFFTREPSAFFPPLLSASSSSAPLATPPARRRGGGPAAFPASTGVILKLVLKVDQIHRLFADWLECFDRRLTDHWIKDWVG